MSAGLLGLPLITEIMTKMVNLWRFLILVEVEEEIVFLRLIMIAAKEVVTVLTAADRPVQPSSNSRSR